MKDEYELKQVQVRLKLSEAEPLYSTERVSTPEKAVEVMAKALSELDREYCCVVNMDAANHPINFNIVSIGDVNGAQVPIQNVFKSAILSNAARIMMFHNHPSGSLRPSPQDMEVTKRLMEAGRIMNIPVIDHIIVAGGTAQHYSFMQNHPQMFKVHEKQEYSVNEPLNETINNFRSVTDRLFNPDSMEGMKPSDIEEVVQAHVSQMIEEYGIDARIQEVIVSGSRCRGMEHEGSDIDVVVSFTGNEKEDDLFNLLHEEKLYLGSVELDINPINTEQSGPLSEYLNGVEKHLEEKRASIEQNKKQVEEYKPLAKVEELLEENYNQIDNVISNVPPDTKEKNKQKTVNFEEYKKVHTRVSMKRKLAEKKAEIARRDCKDHGTEKDVKPHGIGVED